MTETGKELERIEGNIRRACAFAAQYAPGAQADLDALLSANAGMREALEFYAKQWRRNWDGDADVPGGTRSWMEPYPELLADEGKLAQAALGEADDLHPDTSVALAAFMAALRAKLRKAELKYGYTNGWKTEDWEAQCRAHLLEHLHKGDPLDVAAYAMFCHQRGWSTSPTGEAVTVGDPWLPIESAPKDGTWIFLYREPADFGSQATLISGRWKVLEDGDGAWVWPEESCIDLMSDEGRREADERYIESGEHYEDAKKFTHWMPLPPAPGEAPTTSPSERVEKLRAELADCAEQLEQAAAEFNGIDGKEAADSACTIRAAFARALLSDTEGE